jgi:hypothetical protein
MNTDKKSFAFYLGLSALLILRFFAPRKDSCSALSNPPIVLLAPDR